MTFVPRHRVEGQEESTVFKNQVKMSHFTTLPSEKLQKSKQLLAKSLARNVENETIFTDFQPLYRKHKSNGRETGILSFAGVDYLCCLQRNKTNFSYIPEPLVRDTTFL